MMQQKVTMKTIADAVGTSVGTVDRALNNRGRINSEMKARILQTAEELRYRPNLGAKQLKKDRLFSLLIVTSRQPTQFYQALNQGFADALDEVLDFGIRCEYVYADVMQSEEFAGMLAHLNISEFDACVMDAALPQTAMFRKRLQRHGILSLLVNAAGAEGADGGTSICVPPARCAELAADCLAACAGRAARPCLLVTDRSDRFFAAAEAAFTAAMGGHPNIAVTAVDVSSLLREPARLQDPQLLVYLNHRVTETELALLRREDVRAQLLCFGADEGAALLLRTGAAFAAIYDDPYQQAYKSIKIAVQQLIRNYDDVDAQLSLPPAVLYPTSLQDLPTV